MASLSTAVVEPGPGPARLFTEFPPRRPADAGGRARFFDEVRGLYLLWMVYSHALTLAMLAPEHPLVALWPRGWATTGFVMLTGFVLGTRSEATAWSPSARARTYRRAAQVAAIAVVSNILFLLLRGLVEGTLTAASAGAALSLRMPWSISAILLPTAGIIVLAPTLQRITMRTGPPLAFATVLAVVTSIELTAQYGPRELRTILSFGMTEPGYVYFPVLTLLRLAILSYAWGALVISRAAPLGYVHGALAAGALVLTARSWIAWPVMFIQLSQFAAVIGGMSTLVVTPRLAAPGRWLALLGGRAALLLFIAHRVLLQASVRAFDAWLSSEAMLAALVTTTVAGCALLAVLRGRPEVGDRLRAIGL